LVCGLSLLIFGQIDALPLEVTAGQVFCEIVHFKIDVILELLLLELWDAGESIVVKSFF
jgi:hypothetical protein